MLALSDILKISLLTIISFINFKLLIKITNKISLNEYKHKINSSSVMSKCIRRIHKYYKLSHL